CFNPPPATRPGETSTSGAPMRPSSGFNPPPATRPGETNDVRHLIYGVGMFQSAPGDEAGGDAGMPLGRELAEPVQSAPGDEAGGDPATCSGNAPNIWFQSAPGDEAGGDRLAAPDLNGLARFNPPPATRPGETACRAWSSS